MLAALVQRSGSSLLFLSNAQRLHGQCIRRIDGMGRFHTLRMPRCQLPMSEFLILGAQLQQPGRTAALKES